MNDLKSRLERHSVSDNKYNERYVLENYGVILKDDFDFKNILLLRDKFPWLFYYKSNIFDIVKDWEQNIFQTLEKHNKGLAEYYSDYISNKSYKSLNIQILDLKDRIAAICFLNPNVELLNDYLHFFMAFRDSLVTKYNVERSIDCVMYCNEEELDLNTYQKCYIRNTKGFLKIKDYGKRLEDLKIWIEG